jgi:hypothetical protein
MNRKAFLVIAIGMSISMQGYAQSAIGPEEEAVGRMQRNFGRIYGISALNDLIVPKCFSSQEHGPFFRSFSRQFMMEMIPLIEGFKQINSAVIKNKYGEGFEKNLAKVLEDGSAEIRAQISGKFSSIQNTTQLEMICGSYKAQIKNGLFSVQPFAELYLKDLKNVSPDDYDMTVQISATMKNAEAGLRKLATN